MKKLLLLGVAAMMASGAMAQEAEAPTNFTTQPTILSGALITHISPNGVWAASEQFGYIVIANLVEGTFDTFEPDEEYVYQYSFGNGNSVSNNGVFVGTEFSEGAPEYYQDGEWIILPVKESDTMQLECLTNGVSADGNAIVGTVGRGTMSFDEDSQMAFPALWLRQTDGKFGMYVDLPAPAKDLMGKIPQRVTAINISADGKTIAGQIVDNSGFMIQPVVFVQDADGNWSYKLPCEKMYHPDITLPEEPGEGPVRPDYSDYMTADKIAEYDQAVNDYWDGLIEDYPEITDYMTDAKAEEYEAAMAIYNQESDAYMAKVNEYYTALDEYMAAMPLLTFNNSYLSADGRYLLSSISKGSFWNPEYYPALIDLQEDKMYISENEGLSSFVNNDGAVLAAKSFDSNVRTAWISQDFLATATPLQDYVKGKNEEVYNFMNDNMRHDYESYDPETWEPVVNEGMWTTGSALATDDLGLIVTWTFNFWNFDDDAPYFYSYILPVDYKQDGIRTVESNINTLGVRGEGHGVVAINGEANRLEVYDAQGRLVFRQDAPEARVATNLPAGIYMLKAYNAQGKSVSAKAAL